MYLDHSGCNNNTFAEAAADAAAAVPWRIVYTVIIIFCQAKAV